MFVQKCLQVVLSLDTYFGFSIDSIPLAVPGQGSATQTKWCPECTSVSRPESSCMAGMAGAKWCSVGKTSPIARQRTAAHGLAFAANACRAGTCEKSHGCTGSFEKFLDANLEFQLNLKNSSLKKFFEIAE